MHNFGNSCGCAMSSPIKASMLHNSTGAILSVNATLIPTLSHSHRLHTISLLFYATVSLSANGVQWVYYFPTCKSSEEIFMELSESLKCAP